MPHYHCVWYSESSALTVPLVFEDEGLLQFSSLVFGGGRIRAESSAKALEVFTLCHTAEGPPIVPGGHSESLGLITLLPI